MGTTIEAKESRWSVSAIELQAHWYEGIRTESANRRSTSSMTCLGAASATKSGDLWRANSAAPSSLRAPARLRIASACFELVPDPTLESANISAETSLGWRIANRVAVTPPQETPRITARSYPKEMIRSAAASAQPSIPCSLVGSAE